MSTNLLTRNSSIVFKGKQHINHVFITNLIITIVTNNDPFCNSGYKWYVSQGGQHSPKYKDEIHVRYRFLLLTYTSLYPNIFIKYALPYVLTYLFFY
jgi:hypothetical protein